MISGSADRTKGGPSSAGAAADEPRDGDSAAPVDGVVLAAGRSARMGRPKPLLELDGATFLSLAVAALRGGGCRAVHCVVARDAPEVAAEARRAGAGVVVNPEPGSEPHDSLRLALRSLGADAAAAVVLPVDHPTVSAATVAAVIAAFRARRAPIVRAAAAGRAGHPTLFARPLFPELEAPELPAGARTVVQRHIEAVEDVAVEDVAVHADIDTPAELRRWRELP